MLVVNDKVACKWYNDIMQCLPNCDWGHNALQLMSRAGDSLSNASCSRRLSDMVRASRNQDWLMHLTKKRYRDHNSHQCYVALLGWYLLHCEVSLDGGNEKKTFLKYASDVVELCKKEVETAWWIASLLHDHAYPLASLAESMCCLKYLRDKECKEDLARFIKFTESYSDLFSRNLCDAFLDPRLNLDSVKARRCKILHDFRHYLVRSNDRFSLEELGKGKPENPYDHGLWSALNLAVRLQERVDVLLDAEYDDTQCLRLAVQTIALHNNTVCHKNRKFDEIPVNKYPLGFLLLLVDELQEWNRQLVVNDELLSPCSEIRMDGSPLLEESKWPEELSVTFVFNDGTENIDDWSQDIFVKLKRKKLQRLTTPKTFDSIKQIVFSASSNVPLRKGSTI